MNNVSADSVPHTGRARRRHEDPRLLTGKGYYAADLSAPGMLVAAVLRSPLAHARLGTIDTKRAAELAGVAAVFTADDIGSAQMSLPSFGQFSQSLIERWRPTIRACPHPTLARGKVRYVGQPVALVIAQTREIAEDALELIEVDYEPIPTTMNVEDSLRDDAVRIFDEHPDNVALDFKASIGDADSAFERATHIVRDQFSIQRYTGMALEGRGILAVPERDGMTVWASHQLPHFLRNLICEALQLPQYSVRVIQPDIGGGFGQKAGMYSEDVLIPFAAKKLGRPVKWLKDKGEQLVGSNHSRQQEFDIELALDANAKIMGLRYSVKIDAGGYLTFPVVLSYLGMCHLLGPYRIPTLKAHIRSVLTNKTHSAPSRGAGRPEAVFVLNRIMDRAAQQIGIDPIEIRRRNFIPPSDMLYEPGILYRDGNTMVIDSGDYPEALQRLLNAVDREAFKKEQNAARANGRYIGLGIECNVEAGGLGRRWKPARNDYAGLHPAAYARRPSDRNSPHGDAIAAESPWGQRCRRSGYFGTARCARCGRRGCARAVRRAYQLHSAVTSQNINCLARCPNGGGTCVRLSSNILLLITSATQQSCWRATAREGSSPAGKACWLQ
jgi:aerobic carbon-monoxide dehydrogenase large subunit